MPDQKESWHLSKNVPVAIIVTLLVQFSGGIWFFAQMDGRVTANTNDVMKHDTAIRALQTSAAERAVSLARIEENLSGMRSLLERIERQLAVRQ